MWNYWDKTRRKGSIRNECMHICLIERLAPAEFDKAEKEGKNQRSKEEISSRAAATARMF